MQAAIQERWYQEECVEALYQDVILSQRNKNTIHPLAVVPTGGGKSVILCKLIDKYLSAFPHRDVLVLSHVFEILEQNHSKINQYMGNAFLGLYSSGLGSRETSKITVAGIQSVVKKPELFKNVGLVIVDECDLVNSKADVGRYRKFLSNLDAVCVGLTATPFRTGQGYIYKEYKGFEPLFNKLSYDLSSYENYNRLVREGWLAPLISAPTDFKFDTTGIHKSAGDFNIDELSDKFDRIEITKSCISQTIKYARDKYKKWLIFAIDIQHCENIARELNSRGIKTAAVHSEMDISKKKVLKDYKNGKYRALINVNMLTTGVDVPDIDLLVHMRPSESARHHVQSNGRGARPAPGKTHCLVLDFAGNTRRHGPVNDVYVKEPSKKKGKGGPLFKICENCGTENSAKAKNCIACDEEFTFKEKLELQASNLDIVKTGDKNQEEWADCQDIFYFIHQKPGAPDSFRVDYYCGMQIYSEFVCIDHSGYAKARAKKWIWRRYVGMDDFPNNVNSLYNSRFKLKRPSKIKIKLNEKRKFEVVDHKWGKGDNLPDPKKNKLMKFGEARKENKTVKVINQKWEEWEDDIPF